jgi:hypothetical protein
MFFAYEAVAKGHNTLGVKTQHCDVAAHTQSTCWPKQCALTLESLSFVICLDSVLAEAFISRGVISSMPENDSAARCCSRIWLFSCCFLFLSSFLAKLFFLSPVEEHVGSDKANKSRRNLP